MSSVFLGLAASLVALSVTHEASARSFRVNDIPNGATWKCIDCHLTNNGSGYTNFGQDAANALVGSGLTSSQHVDWKQLCHLDSDGDGQTNGQELGDPGCTWQPGQPNPPGPTSNPGDPNSKLSSICGNGVREGNEQCDGSDLGGATCGSLGLGSGALTCSTSCKLVTSGCSKGSSGSGASGSGSGPSGSTSGSGAGGEGPSGGFTSNNSQISSRNPPPIYPAGCSASQGSGTPLGALAFFVLGAAAAFRTRGAALVRSLRLRVGEHLGPALTVVLVATVAAMAALAGCIQTSAINQGFGGTGGTGAGSGGAGNTVATTGSRGNATSATTGGPSATAGNGATSGNAGATTGGNGATVGAATTGSGPTAGATTSATTSAGSGGGGTPTTCAQADGNTGCCAPSGKLYYCSTTTLQSGTCPAGTVCGWNATQGYYDCVPPPGGADPSGTYPMACGGGGGGSTTSSTTSSGSGGGAATWTQIYGQIFGPNGTSTCAGGSCHSGSVSGFACGSTKTSCYNGMVSSGLVTPGASATSSSLVDPATSCLCGSLGGNMPKGGVCVTQAQLDMINSWLASGAPNN